MNTVLFEKPLNIYLDSRDLIELAERQSKPGLSDFDEWLQRMRGKLVFSLTNIRECCAPLSRQRRNNSIMRMLVRLERLPHVFIAEAKIHRDEMDSAVSSYMMHEDYKPIDPYVQRFDDVLSPFRRPMTKIYLKYGLANTVFDLWRTDPNLFSPDDRYSQQLAALRESDRQRPDHRRHEVNFVQYVRRTLSMMCIRFPHEETDALADWIWKDSTRCPSIHFGYELYHQILKNTNDTSGNSDLGDLAHADCLPYVDAMTLDRRMRGYVTQTDRTLRKYSQTCRNCVQGYEMWHKTLHRTTSYSFAPYTRPVEIELASRVEGPALDEPADSLTKMSLR